MLDGPRWGPRKGRAEQLVVLCHGVGADGHDLIDLAPTWAAALPAGRLRRPRRARALRGRAGRPAMVRALRTARRRHGCRRGARHRRGSTASSMPSWRGWLARRRLRADGFQPGRDDGAARRPAPGGGAARDPGFLGRPARPRAPGAKRWRARRSCWCMARPTRWCPPRARARRSRRLRAAGFAVESLYCPGLGHGIDDSRPVPGRAVAAAGLRRGHGHEAA